MPASTSLDRMTSGRRRRTRVSGTRRRSGQSGGVLALGLFLLSLLIVLPLLSFSFKTPDVAPANTSFVFSDRASSSVESKAAPSTELKIRGWHYMTALGDEIAQFQTVFWEPDDTNSMRRWLATRDGIANYRILEIGTGTGLVALTCLKAGAASVVATDINPAACANVLYNAERLQWLDRLDVRQVSEDAPEPFSVIDSSERFDIILSNPPWEDAPVMEVAAYALYDPRFELLDGILSDSRQYLKEDGRVLLAYGCKTAIQRVLDKAPDLGWRVTICDERELDSLPEVFLPGMLLELQPK